MSEVGKDLWRVVENTGGEVVKFFGEGRAVWKVPAIGSHDLFLVSEKFHERTLHCSASISDSVVGVAARG